MRGPRVILTIDEVRLHGFDPRERAAIGAALVRELEHRFIAQPPAPIAQSVRRIDAGTAVAARSGAPAVVAAGIAAGVHREVKRLC